MKKYLNKDSLTLFICIIIALHPFIELDYLIFETLNKYGLPRFTTVIDFIIIPLFILICLIKQLKDKKNNVLIASVYILLFVLYFIFHHKESLIIFDKLNLSSNYYYSFHDEFFYCLGLLIPILLLISLNYIKIKENTLRIITTVISLGISLPILISDIFVIGYSTYVGSTKASFLSWFTLNYNDTDNDPRFYACKFFFEEGNTIGIILIMILPLMYYYFLKTEKKKLYASVIIIQTLSMVILSTRVASIGAVLVPFAMFVIYLVMIFMGQEKINQKYLLMMVFGIMLSGILLPFSPSINNQLVDSDSYDVQKEILDNSFEKEYQNYLVNKDLNKDNKEFFIEEFESHLDFIKVTPPVYYYEMYPYKHDPSFWCNLVYEYDLDQRIDGRQIQMIFTNDKYQKLNTEEKLSGLGYSTFMHGGIFIEKDFISQNYYLGYLGTLLFTLPWIIILGIMGIKYLLSFKERKWNYLNTTLMMIICIALGAAYLSGHSFNEMSYSLLLAILIYFLKDQLFDK